MDKIIQICVQVGGVGIGIFAIFILYKSIMILKELVTNHMAHNTQALIDLSVVLKELKQLINDKIH